MNNYIFYHILVYINNEINTNYTKNVMLNILEEYIEWFNLSLKRFCVIGKDYSKALINYLEIIQKLQASLLLDEVDAAKLYLIKLIKYYEKSFTFDKI